MLCPGLNCGASFSRKLYVAMIPPTRITVSTYFKVFLMSGNYGWWLTVSESDLPSGSDGSALMTGQVHGVPADNDWHGAVSAACDEEESTVLDVSVFFAMDGEKHGETGNSKGYG